VEIMIVVVIIGLLAAMAVPALGHVRQQSRLKAITTNLRIISGSAQLFMNEKGVSQAAYTDLIGSSTDSYVRSVAPVAGEDYTTLVIVQSQTQLSISSATFGTCTYNM